MLTAKVAAGVCIGILAAIFIYYLFNAATLQWQCERSGGRYGVVNGREVCV